MMGYAFEADRQAHKSALIATLTFAVWTPLLYNYFRRRVALRNNLMSLYGRCINLTHEIR